MTWGQVDGERGSESRGCRAHLCAGQAPRAPDQAEAHARRRCAASAASPRPGARRDTLDAGRPGTPRPGRSRGGNPGAVVAVAAAGAAGAELHVKYAHRMASSSSSASAPEHSLDTAALILVGDGATPKQLAERFRSLETACRPDGAVALLARLGRLGLVRVASGDRRVGAECGR